MDSCANRGSGPQGGPKDEDPPIPLLMVPANESRNVSPERIEITFNENVSLDDSYNNVVFSPPFKNRPEVNSSAKKISVVFSDSLTPNTTYTIDFGNAVVDYNESNVLRDLVYTFSTGNNLDSLRISGVVIDARTMAYKKGISVGLYSSVTDTTFEKVPFEHMAKTRSDGTFTIYNLPEGEYSMFALNDAMQAYKYDMQFGNDIAFFDEVIRPEMHYHGTIDTLQYDPADSLQTQLRVNSFAAYYPDDILLRTFNEVRTREYLRKSQRPDARYFLLAFGAKPTMEPKINLMNFRDTTLLDTTENWFIKEYRTKADSLIYWITDSTVYKNDTLLVSVEYLRSDSVYQLETRVDTVRMIVPRKNVTQRRSRRGQEAENDSVQAPNFMEIGHNIKNSMEVYDTITFNFSEPIVEYSHDNFHLEIEVDSLLNPVPFTITIDDSICTKQVRMFYKKDYGSKYKVSIDSATIKGMYGAINDVFYKTYQLKPLSEYSNLLVRFPEPPENAVVELLSEKEKVVQVSTYDEEEDGVPFQDITPGNYYIRMYIDVNQNGVWDTGDVNGRIQPELTFYYPKLIQLRANWDVEEFWPYLTIPILEQRPRELRESDAK